MKVYSGFILIVILVFASFGGYYLICGSKKYKLLNEKIWGNSSGIYMHYIRRLLGVLFFALIPLFILWSFSLNPFSKDIFLPFFSKQISLWIVALALMLIPINFIYGKNPKNWATYPEIRIKNWTAGTLVISALSWMAYLFAYEYLIRGLLFFTSLAYFGFWPATIINIIIYALVHLPKGRLEVLASIPFGLVLCIATFHTGSIWVAFFAHVILAFSNEWVAIYNNPDMQLKLNRWQH